ncbi:hypothetical protein PV341_16215 [Streptomyces sp. PA03-1a]|nr:hypothetical protein [Streptomyces sp. PA03-1a]MDX2813336.1 hypothetical protein [Streptomyces sp. PA03-5A]
MTGHPCGCEVVRNYDYDEAAEKLRCKKRFLQDNISRPLHQKIGESVSFCDCELRRIQAQFRAMPVLAAVEPQTTTPPKALAAIRPSGPGRKRAAS